MPLIAPEILHARLASVRLLDARQDPAEFAAGHLPGALHADLNRHLSTASDPGFDPAHGGRHPLPDPARFAAQLGAWGIGPDTEVVDARRHDSARKVLDVRTPERYRGDEETMDPVAGHIPGALSAYWADNLDPNGRFKAPEALRRIYLDLLDGTSPDQLTVHCGSGVTARHTLLALEHAGLPGAALYVGSWSEWCRSGRDLALGSQDGGDHR